MMVGLAFGSGNSLGLHFAMMDLKCEGEGRESFATSTLFCHVRFCFSYNFATSLLIMPCQN